MEIMFTGTRKPGGMSKAEAESRSLTGFTANGNCTSVLNDDPFDRCKTDACAFKMLIAMQALKRSE